ncbi:hypothetical protein AAG570_009928 [Ranatra chinensis]|uniref:Uncharacterized protein n=1 Tax=Ranatra chinensis TaxID=642074 RepID=A0ABD0ZDU0_9HEMI
MARKEVPKMIATLMDGLDKAVRTNDIDMVAQMVTKTEWAIKHLKKKETESLNTEEEDCVEESENGEVEDEIEEDDSSEDDDEESVLTLCEVTDEQVDNYLANVIRDVRGRHLRTSPTYP